MVRSLLVSFFLCLFFSASAQQISVSYVNAEGPTEDTIIVSFTNLNPTGTINLGSASMTMVFQSSCVTFASSTSLFRSTWGSNFLAEYEGIQNVSAIYDGVTYDRRYLYGNTNPDPFNPVSIPLPAGNTVEVMRILMTRNCGSGSWKRIEANNEFPGAELSNAAAQSIAFTVDNGAVGLPVEWLAFDAQLVDNEAVQLNWKTGSELNNSHFEVEKSSDGFQFRKIAKVNGQGTINAVSDYQFLDKSDMNTVNYYRIKQIDLDGAFSYSDVRQVEIGELFTNQFRLYPNPVSSTLSLSTQLKVNQSYLLTINDLAGRSVWQEQIFLGKSDWSKDVHKLNDGVYLLNLLNTDSGEQHAFKFLKQ